MTLTTIFVATTFLVAPFQAERAKILDGVRSIGSPGIPGQVAILGQNAFPVVVGSAGRNVQAAIVGAAEAGRSRFVVFGHEGYFSAGGMAPGDTKRLLTNAVLWAAKGNQRAKVLCANVTELASVLKDKGFRTETTNLDANLVGDVLILPVRLLDAVQERRIRAFVNSGGSLVTGGPAWGFLMIHQDKTIQDHPINPFLTKAGLAFADGMTEGTLPGSLYDATLEPSPALRVPDALRDLLKGQADEKAQAQMASSILAGVPCLPEDDRTVRPLLAKVRDAVKGDVVPTATNPITLQKPLERLALALQVQDAQTLEVEKVKAHAAAKEFPGSVPSEAPRISKQIDLGTDRVGWISTGLYAAPGEQLKVEVPSGLANAGLSVRIGAHSDTLWHHDKWERAPAITRVFPVKTAKTVCANAFGGLVYIVVPDRGLSAATKVKVSGAVEAPFFVKGKTSLVEWRNRIRNLQAPWAELQADNMVITVHAGAVRQLNDPDAVCQVYDDASDAQADLAGIDRFRRKPERFVVDQQISAGWMHSGYPIMAYTYGISELSVDSKRMREAPKGETWGHWHELGHNHQRGEWTFDGTVEVTNNVFTLYTMERVSGKKWWENTHPAMERTATQDRLAKHLAASSPFQKWQSDPFLALTQYVQIVDRFGWDAMKKAIAAYHKMPGNQQPRTEEQKRDTWMVTLSRATGANLGPFFDKWGVPVSDEAKKKVSDLPIWIDPALTAER